MAIGSFKLPISSGAPAPTTGEYRVRFIDFDGTVLKEEWHDAGGSATAPTTPTHTYLTFDKWVAAYDYTNVQNDIDVGALYNTTDDKTYLFITLTPSTGLTHTMYLNKATSDTMTIDWGDASTDTSSSSGNVSFSHTYASEGDYLITIECTGNYAIGQGAAATSLFGSGNSLYILTKAYLNFYCNDINSYGFYNYWNLSAISISTGTTSSNASTFNQCYLLNHLTIPDSISSLGTSYCNNSRGMKTFVIPDSVTTIGNGVFNGNYFSSIVMPNTVTSLGATVFTNCLQLEKVVMPNTITSLGNSLFQQCVILSSIIIPSTVTYFGSSVFFNAYILNDIQVLATTPPTLSNINAFTGINKIAKIYVPDASVAAYKAATNWVTYADYIYPLSSRP